MFMEFVRVKYQILKKFLQLSNKKSNDPAQKRAKDLNVHFPKEDKHMAGKP